MLIPTIIIGLLAAVLLVLSYQKGVHIQGLKASWTMLLQILPILVFAMILAGTIQNLLPSDLISRWIGAESGFKGIFIGTVLGAVMPGGPIILLPIAAGFLRMGANIGTMVALMTAWSLIAVWRLPLEIGFLGWKFTAIRLACTILFAPVAGLIANALFPRVRLV